MPKQLAYKIIRQGGMKLKKHISTRIDEGTFLALLNLARQKDVTIGEIIRFVLKKGLGRVRK